MNYTEIKQQINDQINEDQDYQIKVFIGGDILDVHAIEIDGDDILFVVEDPGVVEIFPGDFTFSDEPIEDFMDEFDDDIDDIEGIESEDTCD